MIEKILTVKVNDNGIVLPAKYYDIVVKTGEK